MLKYTTIVDISSLDCYRSHNARLLYLHLACRLDVASYTYTRSVRALADELSMPLQQLRTALRQLVDAGVVKTRPVTQVTTFGVTRKLTQPLTQITLLKVNEIGHGSGHGSNTAANTAANTETNTETNTQKNNIIKKPWERLTHTHARTCVRELRDLGVGELRLTPRDAEAAAERFALRMELKQKTWENHGDMLSHFVSWAEKNRKLYIQRTSDHDARVEELARTKAEEAARDEREKLIDEGRRLAAMLKDARTSGNKQWEAQILEAMATNRQSLRQSSANG